MIYNILKSQLFAFSSSSKKLDNILGMGKLAGNKGGLDFKENTASTSKTTFVPATDQSKYMHNPEPKDKRFVRQMPTRQRRTRRPRNRRQLPHNIAPRCVPTCFHCGELGHIRPRCHQVLNSHRHMSFNRNRNHEYVGQIEFLTTQVSQLTKLVTQLSRNRYPTRQVWLKKGDLNNFDIDHGALKGKNVPIPS